MKLINGADGPISVVTGSVEQEITFMGAVKTVEVAVIDPRFHVNLPGDPALFDAAYPDLAAFRVSPALLGRIFAGDDPAAPALTVALRFEDETAAYAALAPAGFAEEDAAL